MTKEIMIDGRPVKFRATAAIPRMYRIKFRRDIMQDMREIDAAVKKAEADDGGIPVQMLEVFENVAFIMARHADPEMEAATVEDWLDQFDTFSIYAVFPQLMELWRANNETIADAKKKQGKPSGN
nr:MAG TPA_asm: tail assembly chaperone protein [Caudoviricetes sp.]